MKNSLRVFVSFSILLLSVLIIGGCSNLDVTTNQTTKTTTVTTMTTATTASTTITNIIPPSSATTTTTTTNLTITKTIPAFSLPPASIPVSVSPELNEKISVKYSSASIPNTPAIQIAILLSNTGNKEIKDFTFVITLKMKNGTTTEETVKKICNLEPGKIIVLFHTIFTSARPEDIDGEIIFSIKEITFA